MMKMPPGSCRMGSNTFHQGALKFAGGKTLNILQYCYLMLFWGTNRLKRNKESLESYPDPIRESVGLPLGPENAFFVSSKEFLDLPKEMQDRFLQTQKFEEVWDSDVGLELNSDGRKERAELFQNMTANDWVPMKDGSGLEWKRVERSYYGEEHDDTGRLVALEDGSIVKQEACSGEIHNMLGAAASNDVELAKTLPREQLTLKDAFGRTPLMLAAFFKAYEMLDWLSGQLRGDEWQLDAQYTQLASVRRIPYPTHWHAQPDYDSATLFHFLADLDPSNPTVPRLLKRLTNAGVEPSMLEGFAYFSLREDSWHNPLTCAVFSENLPVTEFLLAHGADPNCVHYDRIRIIGLPYYGPQMSCASWPLVHAATRAETRFVKLLLAHGASAHVERKPAFYCEDETHTEAFSCGAWGRAPGVMTPLHFAAYNGSFESVRALVLHGADFTKRCIFSGKDAVQFLRTPRETVEEGLRAEHGTFNRDQPFDESLVAGSLIEYDRAVREAVRVRRLYLVSPRLRPLPSGCRPTTTLVRRAFARQGATARAVAEKQEMFRHVVLLTVNGDADVERIVRELNGLPQAAPLCSTRSLQRRCRGGRKAQSEGHRQAMCENLSRGISVNMRLNLPL
ncbi:hypothetical protein KFL_002150070 [Klebsormidium nitens]|uniref:Uncharacterized protein n=1 Tax=Klebsormidium nitens TaxID=105231 RepID=A0A1Y1I751_KLENI|nr:hypothetical protein KFL_002150070 [Klebsormidium nitens]|eukprot:GAQ84971.1 hypothetical protein KFL_002150070 [Klebsormidium nitens]